MRIGTNHGSLSDRILSRYGDTPLGMVESALEFLRICEDEKYFNIVLSMKASNTQVMVDAYRLLSKKLADGQFKAYPLHLGVTEAGEGEDGRIKSAVGIGTLLEDGLGDTVRVSLTEDPEFEIPVAKDLVNRYVGRNRPNAPIPSLSNLSAGFDSPINPFAHTRRKSAELMNFGGHQVPRVIADYSHLKSISMEDLKSIGHFYLPEPDKWAMNDLGADYLFTGTSDLDFMLPNGLKQIQSATTWLQSSPSEHQFPLFEVEDWLKASKKHAQLNFVQADAEEIWSNDLFVNALKLAQNEVLVLSSSFSNRMAAIRRAFFELEIQGIHIPVVIRLNYQDIHADQFQLFAPTDAGALFIDGFGDGLMLSLAGLPVQSSLENSTNFGILQACRVRISKTEYISCPSCGRTLFDLQETTARIRQVTDHLKGVKIGIMGCIVNGPGEMADADYGYVGIGKDKIALYRGQEVVKKSVPADSAVDELIQLIKEDGIWKDPQETNN